MPKCAFNKVALHIFKTPFPKNTFGWLFLIIVEEKKVFLKKLRFRFTTGILLH